MLGKVLQTFFARPVAKFIFGGANVMARILETGILRLPSQCRNAANMKTCLLRKEYGRDTVKTALTSGSGSPLRVASKRSHAEIWFVLSISFALLTSIARPDCHFPPVCSWSWLVLEKPRFAYLLPWICPWIRPILAQGGLLGGHPCRWQSCSCSGRQAAHGPRGFGPRIEAEGSAKTRRPQESIGKPQNRTFG